jgi:hypothetical protein
MTEQHYHHHFYHHHDPGLCEVKAEIAKLRDLIIRNQEVLMATLDEVLAEVTDESSRLDSIQTLIDGIKQQLADALSGAALPPAVQQKVDAVFAGLTANKAKIDTALNAGTPPPA